MSLVITPTRTSPANAAHSAAIRLDLPDPTGPPTPTRRARSARKQPLPRSLVDRRGELERDRGRGGKVFQRRRVRRDRARGELHPRRQLRNPSRRDGGGEREEL